MANEKIVKSNDDQKMTVVKTVTVTKDAPAADKATTVKKTTVVKKAPVAKKAPLAKKTAAKKTVPAKKTSVVKAKAVKSTVAKKASAAKTAIAKKPTVKKASAKAKAEVIEAVDAVEDVLETAADSVFTKINENVVLAQDAAKQVWFAGLGAVGRAYDEVSTRYVKAGDELQSRYTQLKNGRKELVEDLVTRGEKVQDGAEARIKESRDTVEEQIEVAKERLIGLSSKVDIPARLQDLSDKLESLSKDLRKSA